MHVQYCCSSCSITRVYAFFKELSKGVNIYIYICVCVYKSATVIHIIYHFYPPTWTMSMANVDKNQPPMDVVAVFRSI